MSLSNLQKVMLNYDKSTTAEKAVLDKVYVGYTDAIVEREDKIAGKNFASIARSAFAIDYDVNRLKTAAGFTVVIPVNVCKGTNPNFLFGYAGTATWPISGSTDIRIYMETPTVIRYRFTYYNGTTIIGNLPVGTVNTSRFGVILLSIDLTNGNFKVTNPDLKTITTGTSTGFTSLAIAETGKFFYKGAYPSASNDPMANNASDIKGTYIIEEYLSDDEINTLVNFFTNTYDRYDSVDGYSQRTDLILDAEPGIGSIVIPDVEVTSTNIQGATASNFSVNNMLNKIYPDTVTGFYNGNNNDTRPLWLPDGWGKWQTSIIEDADMEASGTSAWSNFYPTYMTISKVAGSPSGVGSQALRCECIANGVVNQMRLVHYLTNADGYYPYGYEKKMHKISMWVRTSFATAGVYARQNLSPESSDGTIGYATYPRAINGVASDGNWRKVERYSYAGGVYFQIANTNTCLVGDYFEVDDCKIECCSGDRAAIAFDGYQQYISTSSALNDIVSGRTSYTLAWILDTRSSINDGTNRRFMSDTTSTGGRLFDLYNGTNNRQWVYYTKPTASSAVLNASFNPKNPLGKNVIVLVRSGDTLSFYLNDELIFSKSDLGTETTTISTAHLASIGGTSNFNAFLFGGFWGWKSVQDHTTVFNKIKQIYSLGDENTEKQFGSLVYAYDCADTTDVAYSSDGYIGSVYPILGSSGPTLTRGSGAPMKRSIWGYGGNVQRSFDGYAEYSTMNGQATRSGTLGDYTIATVFQKNSSSDSRIMIIRGGTLSSGSTDMLGTLSVMSSGYLYWYVTPIPGGTNITGTDATINMSVGTRHCAIIRRTGSLVQIYLDGTLVGSGSIGSTATTPSRNECIYIGDDNQYHQAGYVNNRCLFMWDKSVDVTSLNAYMKRKYGSA